MTRKEARRRSNRRTEGAGLHHDPVLRRPAAADYCGMSPGTFANLATKGEGPTMTRLAARCVGYRLSDLNAWLDARRCRSTSEQTEAEASVAAAS